MGLLQFSLFCLSRSKSIYIQTSKPEFLPRSYIKGEESSVNQRISAMAPNKTSLKEVVSIELDKSVGFVVRVVRSWSVPQWGNEEGVYAIHMLLQDEKGVRIHASIEEALLDKFKNKIEEHGFYAMKNFRVAVNQEKFKPAIHPFRFHFQQNTKILPAKREQLHS